MALTREQMKAKIISVLRDYEDFSDVCEQDEYTDTDAFWRLAEDMAYVLVVVYAQLAKEAMPEHPLTRE